MRPDDGNVALSRARVAERSILLDDKMEVLFLLIRSGVRVLADILPRYDMLLSLE